MLNGRDRFFSTLPDSTLPENLWAIVLAAGDGSRLLSVTRLLCGSDVPKQFAAIDGDRTLLQQTMDRIGAVVSPDRTVVVISPRWQELAEAQLARYPGVQIVAQPANIGTGPGVMLPLSLIKAQCPDAMVVVTPSDHHIPVREAFETALLHAVELAPRAPAGLALLGADAETAATDLGWMVPQDHDESTDLGVPLVARFVEKPPIAVARELLRSGGLWNTLIVVGSAKSFWGLARDHMPRQLSLFDQYVNALMMSGGRPDKGTETLLTRLYRSMPPADFSRTILENSAGLAVVRLQRSGWCDCGTPERLLKYLDEAALPTRRRQQLRNIILNALQADADLQAI